MSRISQFFKRRKSDYGTLSDTASTSSISMATTQTTKKKKRFSNFRKALCLDSENDNDTDYVDEPNPASSDTSTSRESRGDSNSICNTTSFKHIEQENEVLLHIDENGRMEAHQVTQSNVRVQRKSPTRENISNKETDGNPMVPQNDQQGENKSKGDGSPAWTYFEMIGEKHYKCKLCINSKKYKYSHNTTNLFNHLFSKHKREYHIAKGTPPDAVKEGNLTKKDSKKIPEESTVNKITSYLSGIIPYSKNSDMKLKLDRLVALFVAEDYQPVSVVENTGFKRLVRALNPRYRMISRKKLTTKLLPAIYLEAKNCLKNLLLRTTAVSITTDTWTSVSNKSYLAITCHFFVDDDMENVTTPPKLYSAALDVILITKDEKADTLSEMIKDCLIEWEIYEKTNAVVTDNASNMKAAVEKLPERIKHFPCFAHSLNLVVKNSIVHCSSPIVKDVISKVKAIVTYFHKSSKALRILDEENLKLLEDGQRMPING